MTRKFKVQALGAAYGPRCGAPELRFRGRWLAQAGFNPGASFTLSSPEPGVIQLRIDGPAQLTAKDFTKAITAFTQLGI